MKAIPTIPGYELLARLGGGLLTSVYAARHAASDSPCAVKLIREDWEDPATAVKLLQREARACLAVQHPHLVRLREAHVTSAPYFLIMELLPGESLRRRLQRDYRLDVPTALWVARQTAEALTALHGAGFLHGDVKPDNVRLLGAGNAVLLDLGFAHRPGENASLLRRGYLLGTVDYLAPELCAATPKDDPGSDLFSLGVMLFEMLSGQLPYPPGSIDQTIRRHELEQPDEIRRHLPGLNPALARLVSRLLSRRPADRPRAHALVRQLVALEITALQRRKAA
jgi:serine/threonine protein kinase